MPKFKDWKHAELFVAWAQRMVDAGKLEAFDREAVMESTLRDSDALPVRLESENARNLCQWHKSGPAGKLLFAAPYDGRVDDPVPSYATPEPDCLAKREETPVKPTAHDSHYKAIEARGVEPIAVMEAIICAGLPAEYHSIAKRNLCLAMEAKYTLRLGEKDDQEKELDKGDNYRYRARHGVWPWGEK